MRVVIALRADHQAAANTAVAERTGNPADDQTFTVPLYRPNGNVVGYIANWNFAARSYTVEQIASKLADALGLSASQVATRDTAQGMAIQDIEAAVFNVADVTVSQFLDYFSLSLTDPTAS